MWLTKLQELKHQANMSSAQIAKLANLPERTVVRIFSGETPNPYIDTIHRIVVVLNGSLDDILTDTSAVVGNANMAALHAENERLKQDIGLLQSEKASFQDQIAELVAEKAQLQRDAEINTLRMQLAHKEEIIALHEYYNQRNKKD